MFVGFFFPETTNSRWQRGSQEVLVDETSEMHVQKYLVRGTVNLILLEKHPGR